MRTVLATVDALSRSLRKGLTPPGPRVVTDLPPPSGARRSLDGVPRHAGDRFGVECQYPWLDFRSSASTTTALPA